MKMTLSWLLAVASAQMLFASVASAQACTSTTIFQEDFEGGALPPGWSVTNDWYVVVPPCEVSCGGGFAAYGGYYPNIQCNCRNGTSIGNCCNNDFLDSPVISLPPVVGGAKIVLSSCWKAKDDWLCSSNPQSNHVEVLWNGGSAAVGKDLTPWAGQDIVLRWVVATTDQEGYAYLIVDDIDITVHEGTGADCNGNLVPDDCDLSTGASQDCNGNLAPDECDINTGASSDCNANGAPDECDIAAGLEQDCDADGVPDACAIASGAVPDCNGNGVPDSCDLASGTSNDFDANSEPDECQCTNTHFYCVGGVNSQGKTAAIGYDGVTSIALNQLTLTVKDAQPNQIGIFFMGSFKTQAPFGDGFLCLTGNIERLMPPVFLDSTGAGSYMVDFTNPISPLSTIQPLSEWNLQFWYRDPQTIGNQFNLSNGLHMHFCP